MIGFALKLKNHENDDRQVKKAEYARACDTERDPIYIPVHNAQRDAERAVGAAISAALVRHHLSQIQAAGAL